MQIISYRGSISKVARTGLGGVEGGAAVFHRTCLSAAVPRQAMQKEWGHEGPHGNLKDFTALYVSMKCCRVMIGVIYIRPQPVGTMAVKTGSCSWQRPHSPLRSPAPSAAAPGPCVRPRAHGASAESGGGTACGAHFCFSSAVFFGAFFFLGILGRLGATGTGAQCRPPRAGAWRRSR